MKGLLYLLLVSLISLSSCRREPCQNPGSDSYTYIKIGDSTRSKVPHTGYDTLVFYNQYGDTVFLRGTGVEKSTEEFTYQGDPECGWGNDRYFTDNERLNYRQDDQLSNTSKQFPLSFIGISADSNDDYPPTGNDGFEILECLIDYHILQDGYYHETIQLNNTTYRCRIFGYSGSTPFYYSHYNGVLRIIENDTIIWDRKLN